MRTRWLAMAAPMVLSACATMGPPQPPSLMLPKPPSDLRATRNGSKVVLTWTPPAITTDRQTIRTLGSTSICRSPAQMSECGTPVSQAPPPSTAKSSGSKATESYTDTLPLDLQSENPSASITYGVEVLNRNGRGAGLSNLVEVPLIRTLPPPANFAAQVTSQGIVLTWTAEPPPESSADVHYLYRVHRQLMGSRQETIAGELPAGSEREFTLTDPSFEWEKTYEYQLQAVTVISEPGKREVDVNGEDSPAVKVFADDVFPPAVPSGLQAVYSGAGGEAFIDLIWTPVSDADLAGYNIYRSESGGAAVKLNRELVKTPAFRDATVAVGKSYVYSVTSVDARGNESARSEEASERVP
ncbi:MAG TPA: hypothetical protein VMG31_12565 [Verrucomicrobiae bacterium]|nr:hypothetical protein [Verrucomicrobiae bacterium]